MHTFWPQKGMERRASPDEGSAQCRGHLRNNTNIKIHTIHTHIHSNKTNMKGWLWRPNDIRGSLLNNSGLDGRVGILTVDFVFFRSPGVFHSHQPVIYPSKMALDRDYFDRDCNVPATPTIKSPLALCHIAQVSGDQPALFVQEHFSQYVYLDVCRRQEQNAQYKIRKEWRGGRFGALRLVYDDALQGMV